MRKKVVFPWRVLVGDELLSQATQSEKLVPQPAPYEKGRFGSRWRKRLFSASNFVWLLERLFAGIARGRGGVRAITLHFGKTTFFRIIYPI
jgi:hypothetical protein